MGEDCNNYEKFYQQTIAELGVLFQKGILTGKMFYKQCQWAELHPIPVSKKLDFRPKLRDDIENYDGSLIKILFYEEKTTNSSKLKEFDLWVTFSKYESGWGSFQHFTLIAENKEATSKTKPRDFMERAKIIKFEYSGEEL